ncbi:glycosyltransferase [Legionella sp. CNM-1927-20]|uniref:glycosyltransferase n=1 Tax=Legionella sp. CNM-1927-20 TaxID=3422221 RepID=UPI00403AF910
MLRQFKSHLLRKLILRRSNRRPKILLAPMNIANMPMQVVTKLKDLDYNIEQVQYTMGEGHNLGYALDKEIDVRKYGGRVKAHCSILEDYIERGFDIFHFWNKSLFYNVNLTAMSGFDIPLLKARDKKIIFRFTGFDLRTPSKDMEFNPYSPYRYGYQNRVPETLILKFNDFLHEYVDQFVVPDPELQQFCPTAKIVPRALDLKEWNFIGIKRKVKPLIVHAPTEPVCKGTSFILRAIDDLKDEGLDFEFKLIKNMHHLEAQQWYREADIIIDQILIGATGVLSLEAMAIGKPVVLNLREDLFSKYYKCELPIINANPDNINKQLKTIIQDYEWRKHLSNSGRLLVEKFHNIDLVINDYISMYENVFTKPGVQPTRYADIAYLAEQAERFEMAERILNKMKKDKFIIANIKGESLLNKVAASLPPELKQAVLKQFNLEKEIQEKN